MAAHAIEPELLGPAPRLVRATGDVARWRRVLANLTAGGLLFAWWLTLRLDGMDPADAGMASGLFWGLGFAAAMGWTVAEALWWQQRRLLVSGVPVPGVVVERRDYQEMARLTVAYRGSLRVARAATLTLDVSPTWCLDRGLAEGVTVTVLHDPSDPFNAALYARLRDSFVVEPRRDGAVLGAAVG